MRAYGTDFLIIRTTIDAGAGAQLPNSDCTADDAQPSEYLAKKYGLAT